MTAIRLLSLLCLLLAMGCEHAADSALPPLPVPVLDSLQPAVEQEIQAALNSARANPDDAGIVGRLGMLLHAHRLNDAAGAAYERARLLAPKEPRWAYYHGQVLLRSGDAAGAIAAFRTTLDLRPDYSRAAVVLAELLVESGDLEAAREWLDRALETEPQRADAHYQAGRLAVQVQDPEAAKRHLEAALRHGGDFGRAHYLLATLHRRQGDAAAADRHLAKYEEHREDNLAVTDAWLAEVNGLVASDRPHVIAALDLMKQGRLADAAAAYERALALNPESATSHASLIGIHAQLGNDAKVDRHYREAVRLNPGLPMPHVNMGRFYFDRGRFTDAADMLARAVAIDPGDPGVHMLLAIAAEKSGRPEKAITAYGQVIERGGDAMAAHNALARLHVGAQRYEEAAAHLEAMVLPGDKRAPYILRDLAVLKLRSGDVAGAQAAIERGLTLGRSNADEAIVAALTADLANLSAAAPAGVQP